MTETQFLVKAKPSLIGFDKFSFVCATAIFHICGDTLKQFAKSFDEWMTMPANATVDLLCWSPRSIITKSSQAFLLQPLPAELYQTTPSLWPRPSTTSALAGSRLYSASLSGFAGWRTAWRWWSCPFFRWPCIASGGSINTGRPSSPPSSSSGWWSAPLSGARSRTGLEGSRL